MSTYRIELQGISTNSNATFAKKENKIVTTEAFVEHIMRRTLFNLFEHLSNKAKSSPDGLIMDLKQIHGSPQGLLDYSGLWANQISKELGHMRAHDKEVMEQIVGKE